MSRNTLIFLSNAVRTSYLSQLFLLTNFITNFTSQHNTTCIRYKQCLSGGRY